MNKYILFYFVLIFQAYGCSGNATEQSGDIQLFKHTPLWDLAKAVDKEDLNEIENLVKKGTFSINYQEPNQGQTLIEWAVRNDKYNASEALLNHGANPNIKNSYDGNSALIEAANKFDNTRFLKLLLAHGGDPNYTNFPESVKNFPLTTPLITACSNKNIDHVRILVEAGADVNYKTPKGNSALKQAALSSHVFIVKYLLIDNKAEFNYVFMKAIDGVDLYLTNYMRTWAYPIGSEEWKCKMEIVAFLEKNGMDYKNAKIPKNILKAYPKEYIEQY